MSPAAQTHAAFRLDGRVAWVTGASRGIGREISSALAAAGAEVFLSARDGAALQQLADEIRADGGRAHALPASVADEQQVEHAVARIGEQAQRLDVLVNNAGISPAFTRSEQVASAQWREILDVNLTGAFQCARGAFELLQRDGGGAIVNVSSVHGVSAHERLAAYGASKGGLDALTRTLAVEWAPRGVRVNGIAPGYVETDMSSGLRDHEHWSQKLLDRIPLGRFGRAEEIAPAVVFLAGDASSYLTGATLAIDGGWTAR